MITLKNCLKLILSLTLSLQSVAVAGNLSEKEKAEVTRFRDFLEPMGYQLHIDTEKKQAEVFDKNTKRLAMVLPFAENRDLKKFSPRTVQELIVKEMSKINHANQASFSSTLKNMPAESAMFFMAMGAVMAGQLITNYSQNPIAMKQHIDHQLSPLGAFGFFVFMYSQGFTANVLSMYLKNPKFHYVIPYLGMTVGAFLQTYLSSVMADPNVKMCAKQMLSAKGALKTSTQQEEDPCEKAYEHLVLKKKIWEFAPGIASMLISAGLAAGGQALLTKAVLRVTGFDLAVWLTPGTMQVKGVRMLLAKGLQLSAFVAIDIWLNRKVTYAWKNVFDGRSFDSQINQMNEKLHKHHSQKWTSPSKDLVADLKEYHSKMIDWRMMNMSEVYEAHQAWQEALKNLISMYSASYSYYSSFVNEVRSIKYEQKDNKALLRNYPFNGVKIHDFELNPYDMTLTHAPFVEGLQTETVLRAADKMEEKMKERYYNKMIPKEKQELKEILTQLRSGKREQVALGLKKAYDIHSMPYRYNVHSLLLRNAIYTLTKELGPFEPLLEPGRGFGITFENSSEGQSLKDIPFYKNVGAYPAKNITDYMMLQMVCGHNIETQGNVVHTPKIAGQFTGYPSVFLPPKIVENSNNIDFCKPKYSSKNIVGLKNQSNIYTDVLTNAQGKKFKGMISYIAHNIKTTVAGSATESRFQNWWEKNTDQQMRQAFSEYSIYYNEVVAKMLGRIFNRTRSAWNKGPISNGLINASYQELRTYLFLLEEIQAGKNQPRIEPQNYLTQTVSDKELLKIDQLYTELVNMLAQIKALKNKKGYIITSNIENYQLEEKVQQIQNQLTQVSELFGVGENSYRAQMTLTDSQKEVVVAVLEHIQSLASETMMYGSIANAVSWEKMRGLEQQNLQNGQFKNEVQEKLSQIRSLALPKM